MILRVLNLVVICALDPRRGLRLSHQIRLHRAGRAARQNSRRGAARARRHRRACAPQWGELDNPARIEALAKRFLPLKPITPNQFDQFNQLPDRPPQFVKPDSPDPIGADIENLEEPARS